ncbi:MAG: hypothetical protein KDJ90_00260 [Nitratireductor sp.]|nr:hypothetical protein [Nitratireductor sp.]
MEVDIDRLGRSFAGHDGFDCPHCGHTHNISDSDVCASVVSYWGDDPHDFNCYHCGKDFLVLESVTRQFTAAKTHDELDA